MSGNATGINYGCLAAWLAQNLTEGILRMRYRNSQEKPELANPGKTYHITVDLGATSNVFFGRA